MASEEYKPLEAVVNDLSQLERLDEEGLYKLEFELKSPFDLLRMYGEIRRQIRKRELKISESFEEYLENRNDNTIGLGEDLATKDPLTGLLNLMGLRGRIVEVESALKRRKHDALNGTLDDSKVAVYVFADLNKFKTEANDKYGHAFGDDILRYYAEAMTKFKRGTDAVARIGGDEFAQIMLDINIEELESILEKKCVAFNEYVQKKIREEHPDKKTAVSISLGASIHGIDSENFEQLMRMADKAAYKAKGFTRLNKDLTKINVYIYNPKETYVEKDKQIRIE